jgi:outer membrane receptor for monomeric catechols
MLWLVETLLSISHTTLSETDSKVLSLYPMYSLLQCIALGYGAGGERSAAGYV